ncbi:MAG: CBS domain-containing protein, partial [Planctomycetales bacterium]
MSEELFLRRVKDVMSREVVTLHSQDTVHEALELMVENRVSALPVVNARKQIAGILSTSDLIDLTSEVDEDLNYLDEVENENRHWIVERLAHSLGDRKVSEVMTS